MPVQSTDVSQIANPGLSFTSAGQTWAIKEGVVVSSTQNSGVYSGYASSRLINQGLIFSEAADRSGVNMNSLTSNSYVYNGATGEIQGHVGVTFWFGVVENLGHISGWGETDGF